MKKIELDILALSSSAERNQTYAIILGEKNGTRKVPIVIGAFEAQAIVVSLENIKPGRPLTHDLFYNFLNLFEINILEVIIYKFEESVFYAKLVCIKDDEVVEIDARTSDSIALAVRVGCPIYTYENIMQATGSMMDGSHVHIAALEDSENNDDEDYIDESDLTHLTNTELETMLNDALLNEDYQLAIVIRDEINKRKK
jgi:bifunctional DNase/RNase